MKNLLKALELMDMENVFVTEIEKGVTVRFKNSGIIALAGTHKTTRLLNKWMNSALLHVHVHASEERISKEGMKFFETAVLRMLAELEPEGYTLADFFYAQYEYVPAVGAYVVMQHNVSKHVEEVCFEMQIPMAWLETMEEGITKSELFDAWLVGLSGGTKQWLQAKLSKGQLDGQLTLF